MARRQPLEITVLDRIGGGDGFVGGLLYAILKGWESEKWIQFAWASGVLATTLTTDYAQPADEEQIWSIWKGNARVRREIANRFYALFICPVNTPRAAV